MSSEEDSDDAARNEALGLGGAKLKAVLSEIEAGADGIVVKGGEVLAILHTRMQHTAGDPAARALYGALLRAAGRPYVEMLQQWTRVGTLSDPYEEFCVKESRFINRGTLEVDYTDEYWERRYTVSYPLAIQDAQRFESFISCATVRHLAPLASGVKRVWPRQELEVDDYPEARAYLRY